MNCLPGWLPTILPITVYTSHSSQREMKPMKKRWSLERSLLKLGLALWLALINRMEHTWGSRTSGPRPARSCSFCFYLLRSQVSRKEVWDIQLRGCVDRERPWKMRVDCKEEIKLPMWQAAPTARHGGEAILDPSLVDEPPKLTPHGAEMSHLAERCLHGSPEESEAIEWLSSKFGVVQSQGAQTAPMSGQVIVTPLGICMVSL